MSLRKDPKNALNHLRANEKQKNDLYSHPMSENGFMFMPITKFNQQEKL